MTRSRDYTLLDLEIVKQVLARSPDQVSTHENKRDDTCSLRLPGCSSDTRRPCGSPAGRHPRRHFLASRSIGVERDGTIYELFVSTLPSPAFTASDVLNLYLHRGSFETVLADEDAEQDADRWYSHTPCGQEFCPHPCAVDLESAPGTGAEALPIRTVHHRICQSRGHRACARRLGCSCLRANGSRDVWPSPMGTSFLYPWFSWLCFSPTT
jgi:hypothetical protein